MIKILTANGGSRHAERAVRLSCELARTQKAKLTVLTVTEPGQATPTRLVQNRTMEIARLYKTDIALAQATGQPEQIIRATAREGYDLLVIGARGLHSVQDFFLGRNAIHLVKDFPVTTLVVRKNDAVKHILWRVACGPVDEKQLLLMSHFSNALQADITLLYIEPSAFLFRHRQSYNMEMSEPCEPGGRLDQLRSRISKATGRSVSCRVRTGIPEEVILNEAAISNFDLVAVSVQPRRGLGKLFAEDLPYRIARNMPVSVLLLH